MSRHAFIPASIAMLLALAACSNDGKMAGGTEAESTIALQVQLADGTPAANARVRVLPGDYLSDGVNAAEWTASDGNGFVEMTAEPGDYAVEVRNVKGSVASGAVLNITLDTNTSKVDTVKLGELSTIEGFVFLGRSAPVIRVAGLDRYVVPDSTGHFVIDSLPLGDFNINFADTLVNNSVTLEFAPGDTLYVDCTDPESEIKVFKSQDVDSSKFPEKDWSEHAALLSQIEGYAVGTLGAAGVTDSLGNISEAEGEICIVTTTEDYLIVEDTTDVDSAGVAAPKAVIAPGSLRDCAYREGPTWVLFKESGTYNLQSPLRLKKDKTFDGRGRDVRIAGMGVLTDGSSNLVFENITFAAPAITVLDTSSRRALSIHNGTHNVWVDHCTFEEYPLVELDVKRGSYGVTISWSRFENAQTGVLFGLASDIIRDTAQNLTAHHNYFAGLSDDGILSHGGELHAYNNFFDGVEKSGVVCSDSARCLVENNIFNNEMPVTLYRWYNEDGSPVDSTVGFVSMKGNLLTAGDALDGDALGYKPDYKYGADIADADNAWSVKTGSGAR
jgi:pectate lyase